MRLLWTCAPVVGMCACCGHVRLLWASVACCGPLWACCGQGVRRRAPGGRRAGGGKFTESLGPLPNTHTHTPKIAIARCGRTTRMGAWARARPGPGPGQGQARPGLMRHPKSGFRCAGASRELQGLFWAAGTAKSGSGKHQIWPEQGHASTIWAETL